MKLKVLNKSLIYIILMLIQCAIFGFSFIILQKLIAYNCPTFFILGIRFFVGTITLYAVSTFYSGNKVFLDRESIIAGIICGTIMFIAFSLQTYGANYTSSANNALFTGLYVIFVAIISMLQRKKIVFTIILSAVISLIGVSLVSGFSIAELTFNIGDFLSILCGLGFSIHFVLLEKYASNVKILEFTMMQLVSVSIMSSLVSVCFESFKYGQIIWKESLILLIFLGVVSTALTYLIQSYVQTKIPANVVSIISCSESVFAILFSLLLGYTHISNKLLIGFFLIFTAMLLATKDTHQKNNDV